MSEINRIFLDVDGVLANWVGGVCELLGLDEGRLLERWDGEWGITHQIHYAPHEMWSEIDYAGTEFWAGLEPYPWAHEIYDLCGCAAETTILTSPSLHPSSLAGKLMWLDEHLGRGEPFRDYLIGPCKSACAAPDAVLIDDNPTNCEEFRERGGASILFPRPWNAGRDFTGDEILYIEDELAALGFSYNLSLWASTENA